MTASYAVCERPTYQRWSACIARDGAVTFRSAQQLRREARALLPQLAHDCNIEHMVLS
jgi:hypothetical protein